MLPVVVIVLHMGGGVGLCSGGVLVCWRNAGCNAMCMCVVCGCSEWPWHRGRDGTGASVGQAGVADIAEPAGYVGCHSL